MAESPATRPSLLVRLRDAHDAEAWRDFVRLYGPLVYEFGQRKGLQDADAADLTQEVLHAVNLGAKRLEYDPKRGTFRGWLFTVARRKLCNLLAAQGRLGRGSGDSGTQVLLEEQPSEQDSSLWERDYQRHVFAWAAERVQPDVHESTWQAFWRTVVDGRGVQEVADELGLTAASVYLARSRVMNRLKEQVALWETG
jgi:RNA polymerase sigma factor (sigma-70 family)